MQTDILLEEILHSGIPVNVSGQFVSISGQTIGISGQAVVISGQIVRISGQSMGRTWLLGGADQIVPLLQRTPSLLAGLFQGNESGNLKTVFVSGDNTVSISGQPIGVSGQMLDRTWQLSGLTDSVAISGQTIIAEIASGISIPANISGQTVLISGQVVIVSGQFSGMPVSVSNQPVIVSGQPVGISGQMIDRTWRLSGSTDSVAISGQVVIISGQSISISGQLVLIAGQSVLVSGQPILVSGQPILVSGQPVLISGQPISSGNIIDTGNSTTTPLGAGATFTGTSKDLTGFSQVSIMAFTDQNSAVNGLQIQYSTDNINFDHVHTSTVTANDSISLHYPVDAKFMRVVYTNGGTIQTVFRLQTNLKPIVSIGTIKDIGLPLLASDDSVTTHSVITGITTAGGGAYVDVKVSPSGAIQVGGSITVLSGSITNISGNVVNISGQVINVSGQMSGQPVRISGQMLDRTWQLSGLTDSVAISGQTIVAQFASGISIPVNVSGQTVGISGQSIVIELASGVSIPTNISGQPVQVSGQTIVTQFASGVTFPVDISGQTVITQFASGVTIATSVSGQPVRISGEVVIISGQFVSISGQAVRISGQVITGNLGRTWTLDKSTDSVLPQMITDVGTYRAFQGNVSGNLFVVFLSGDNTVTVSGQPISISGQTINISGQSFNVSGQPMQITGLNITASPISSYYNVVGSSFANAVLTSDGALMIAEGSIVDPNNSTNAQLPAFGFFSGQFRDLTGYSQITIFVYSDVVPPSQSLIVVFSDDGISVSAETKFFTIQASGDVVHLPVKAKFYQIYYSNGASPTSSFRIQVILSPIPSTATIKELNRVVSLYDDALTTRGVIAGPIPVSSSYADIAATQDGKLYTLSFVSGQPLGRTWQLSGITDSVRISGQVVNISGQMSGQPVGISGQAVVVSGQFVSISGQKVSVSGQVVVVFGLAQGTPIGLEANTAGNLIVAISGQAVNISGQIVNISGQIVNISGQMSGLPVSVSGGAVNISGMGIKVIGENIVALPADTRFNVVGSSFADVVTTSGGALMVANGLEPDANNFTTTALGIFASYNGTFRDLTGYSQITINVVTDVPGTLIVTFATGFATGSTETKYYSILGLYPETIHIPVNAKFYRIGYTNGSVAQIIFRLQSLLTPIPSVGTVRNIDRPIEAEMDSMITHTVVAGPIAVGGSSFIDNVVLPDGQSLVQINQSGQVFGVDGYNKALIQEDVIHRKIHQGTYFYADVSQSASQSDPAVYAIIAMSGVNPHLSWHLRGLTPGMLVNVLEVTSARQTTGTVSSNVFLNRTVTAFTSTRLYSSYVLGSNVGANSILFETQASGETAYGFGNLYTYPLIPAEWVLKGGFTYVFQIQSARLPSLTTLYANWYESGLA